MKTLFSSDAKKYWALKGCTQRQLYSSQNELITRNSPYMLGLTQQQYNSTIKDTCWEDVEDELLAIIVGVLGLKLMFRALHCWLLVGAIIPFTVGLVAHHFCIFKLQFFFLSQISCKTRDIGWFIHKNDS